VVLAESDTETEKLQPAIGLSRGTLLNGAGVARIWSPLPVGVNASIGYRQNKRSHVHGRYSGTLYLS
jgi:hypothetical protein